MTLLRKTITIVFTGLMAIAVSLFLPRIIRAQTQHFTMIINQLRGNECCEPGSIELLKQQVLWLKDKSLTANFTLRFDALNDPQMVQLLKDSPHDIGGYLEITPSLAQAANVNYTGKDHNWYQAQHAYLIGYNQQERKQLIDTYMAHFYTVFGHYPNLTTAWMIDSWSLNYLKSQYQVRVHQITREQFGTDSYTLYGGPAHHPYWPSSNWALVPSPSVNHNMPLIIRQTITDPVYNYGDISDSYTSQPNDYLLADKTTDYFRHLFHQAHNQPTNNFTFALVGLENSMPNEAQQEFDKQLQEITEWQKDNNNYVINADDFFNWYSHHYQSFWVYAGTSSTQPQEQAWWITTDTYRARLRLSAGQLFISDLRIYSPDFRDPYYTQPAQILGWWIAPFIVDGSRYWIDSHSGTQVRNDYLRDREDKYGQPGRISVVDNVSPSQLEIVNKPNSVFIFKQNKTLISFTSKQICFASQPILKQNNNLPMIGDFSWNSNSGQPMWGFNLKQDNHDYCLSPFVSRGALDQQRKTHQTHLFPELDTGQPSQNSRLKINNAYAAANRNPIRLVLFPHNQKQEPIFSQEEVKITTIPQADQVEVKPPNPENGMIFIDIHHRQPTKMKVRVNSGDFSQTNTVYFTPLCKQQLAHCLTHPRQAWWYIHNWWHDRQRARQEIEDQAAQFID